MSDERETTEGIPELDRYNRPPPFPRDSLEAGIFGEESGRRVRRAGEEMATPWRKKIRCRDSGTCQRDEVGRL